MRCPGCQHENPAGSNFCLGCGARLALACAVCGADLPAGACYCNKCGAPVAAGSGGPPRFASPGAYTPKHLAEKILTSKAALEGERKQVTVLFADLKGSMELLDEARRLGDRAVELSPGHQGFMAHALHLLGDIATHPDRLDAERGEAHYPKALALAEPRGMRPLIAHCHLGLGKLYRRTAKRQEAREHLTTATTMYRETDMLFWLEQAEAELRELA